MGSPIVLKPEELDALLDEGYPVLCLVTQNSSVAGLRLTVTDFLLDNGGVMEIRKSEIGRAHV